jgi:hypothetical protein
MATQLLHRAEEHNRYEEAKGVPGNLQQSNADKRTTYYVFRLLQRLA